MAGLYAGSLAVRAHAADAGAPAAKDDSKDKDKASCKGQNDCKGKGGCKSADHDCKGKNDCKGKGGCGAKEMPAPEPKK